MRVFTNLAHIKCFRIKLCFSPLWDYVFPFLSEYRGKERRKSYFFLSHSIDTFSMLNKDFFKEEKVNDCVMMFRACSCPSAPSNSTTYFPDELKLSMMASLKNNMRTIPTKALKFIMGNVQKHPTQKCIDFSEVHRWHCT